MEWSKNNIKINKIMELIIDFDVDQLKDIEIIKVKRDGKCLIFPLWEFWQVLNKQ